MGVNEEGEGGREGGRGLGGVIYKRSALIRTSTHDIFTEL